MARKSLFAAFLSRSAPLFSERSPLFSLSIRMEEGGKNLRDIHAAEKRGKEREAGKKGQKKVNQFTFSASPPPSAPNAGSNNGLQRAALERQKE